MPKALNAVTASNITAYYNIVALYCYFCIVCNRMFQLQLRHPFTFTIPQFILHYCSSNIVVAIIIIIIIIIIMYIRYTCLH